jgi:hypothetical protein
LSEVEGVQLKKCSFKRVVKKWTEFWRWQSKVIEKKMARKELGGAKKTSCVI